MPDQKSIAKATLQEISWNDDGEVVGEEEFEVQFNPESLSIALSNQVDGGDQAGGSAIQFTSKGSTKLTFDLFFDVTDPQIEQRFNADNKPTNITDVRKITKLVADFMQTKKTDKGKDAAFIPPAVRFKWGTFRFDGVVDSLTENIDFFSEQGVPLRSTLSVSISKQDVDFQFNSLEVKVEAKDEEEDNDPAGTKETTAPGKDEKITDHTGKKGSDNPWQGDALVNGIENPRDLPMGRPLKLGSKKADSINAGLAKKAGSGSGAGQAGGLGGSFGDSIGSAGGGGRSKALELGAGSGFEIDASTELALNSGSTSDSAFEADFNF